MLTHRPEESQRRAVRFLVTLSAAAAVALSGAASVAGAAPWTATYDWQGNSQTGYENWESVEAVPDTGAPGPFYEVWRGTAPASVGRGIATRPIGGRVYDNGNPASQTGGPGVRTRWIPPGASTIRSAQLDQLRYRNENDDQYFRLRLLGPGGAPVETRDYGPIRGQADPTQTYALPSETLTTAAGTGVEAGLFTVCSPNPPGSGIYACANVPTTTGTFGRVGRVALTLDDPDTPLVQVATSPDISDGWVNRKRAQRLTVTATDSSSGIERIRIQATNSITETGGGTIHNQPITCDRLHRTADRGGRNCPPTATTTKSDSASAQGSNGRTYTITATDDAGNISTPLIRRIRYDTTPPKPGEISGALRRLLGRWTNSRGTFGAVLRASDSKSGVDRVELFAQRVAGGGRIPLGTADVDCSDGCRSATTRVVADIGQLARDGVYRLQTRARDRAGNVSEFRNIAGQIKIDRTAPKPVAGRPFFDVIGRNQVKLFLPAGRDNSGGSGLRNYVVRYFEPGEPSSAPQVLRARVTDTGTARVRKQTFRTITLSRVDNRRPIEAPITACDGAQFGAPQPDLDNEVGNCPPVTIVPARKRLTDDDIYKGLRLAEQQREVSAAAQSSRFVSATRSVLKFAANKLTRTAIGAIVGTLAIAEKLGCDAPPTIPDFFAQGRRTSIIMSSASRESRRMVSSTSRARRAVDAAKRSNAALLNMALRGLRNYGDDKDCSPPFKVAEIATQQNTDTLGALDQEILRLNRLRAGAKRRGVRLADWRVRVEQSSCSRDPNGNTPAGGSVLYYVKNNSSPTPALRSGVIYVGKTNNFSRRCRQHIRNVDRFSLSRYGRLHVFAYDLGRRLSGPEARAGEQVLIDAYGRQDKRRNYNYDLKRAARAQGELLNLIDAVPSGSGQKTLYCTARQTGVGLFQAASRPETAFIWTNRPGFARRVC